MGLWFLGAAALVLVFYWGVGRLPLRAAAQDMSHLQNSLMELVELPELPPGTVQPAGSPGSATSGAVPASFFTSPITPALSLTNAVSSTAGEPPSMTLASAQGSDMLAAEVATAIAGPTAPTMVATVGVSSTPTTTGPTTTRTAKPAVTPTASATPAAKPSLTPTASATPAAMPTLTSSASVTLTATPAITSSARVTQTATPAITSSASVTLTVTPAITSSASVTLTATPTMTSTASAIAAAASLTSTSAAAARTPAPTAQAARYYTVQAGDTLMEIGVATGTDWQQIATLNGITDETSLQLGQQLRLPAPESSQATPTTTAAGKMTTYQVQAGDTLGSIGVRFGMDSQTIVQANGLDVDAMLQVGQELQIPAPSGQP